MSYLMLSVELPFVNDARPDIKITRKAHDSQRSQHASDVLLSINDRLRDAFNGIDAIA